MEKVLYVAWRPAELDPDAFADRLRGPVAEALLARGARGLTVNVADSSVSGAVLHVVATRPQMAAVLSVWVDAAADRTRRGLDDVVRDATARAEAYLVCESEPLRNAAHPAVRGERTEGVNNIAFLRRPASLDPATWLRRWQEEHTQVAIDTQSTFGYVQNVVVRALTPSAPQWDGIVEELFPAPALTDMAAMFDAAGEPAKYAANLAAMTRSTGQFIAPDALDVLPTSQYLLDSPFR